MLTKSPSLAATGFQEIWPVSSALASKGDGYAISGLTQPT
jgi:hypothetical protein